MRGWPGLGSRVRGGYRHQGPDYVNDRKLPDRPSQHGRRVGHRLTVLVTVGESRPPRAGRRCRVPACVRRSRPPSPAAVPPPAPPANRVSNPADEEADQPENHGNDKDEPQKVDGKAQPAEQREDEQQDDQGNHMYLQLVSSTLRCLYPIPALPS